MPFDLEENKAIFLDKNYDKVLLTRVEIKQRIEAIQKKPTQFHSQVQQYMQLKQLKLFEQRQQGKDKLMMAVLQTLLRSSNLQTGLIAKLYKELVEKPKQLPKYGKAALLSGQGALQRAVQQALEQRKKVSSENDQED